MVRMVSAIVTLVSGGVRLSTMMVAVTTMEGVRTRINSRKEEMKQRLTAAEVFSIFFLHFD